MSEQRIQGDFYFANQSRRYRALLILSDNVLTVCELSSNRVLVSFDKSALHVSSRLGKVARVIQFTDGSIFETQAHDCIDQLLLEEKQAVLSSSFFSTQLHRLENKLHYVVLMLFCVVAFVWGVIQYGLPLMAYGIAKMVPSEFTQTLGRGSLQFLDEHYLKPTQFSSLQQQRIEGKLQPILKEYNQLNVQIAFRQGGKLGANAFAFPDAHIVLTDELLQLSQNDDEIIAIVAHEIGHIKQQHFLRRVVQNSMMTVLAVLLTGDVSYASSVIIALPTLLLELSYSRGFEREADQFVYDYLRQHGISLGSFVHIMQRLQAQQKDKNQSTLIGFLSTHPQTEERLKLFTE